MSAGDSWAYRNYIPEMNKMTRQFQIVLKDSRVELEVLTEFNTVPVGPIVMLKQGLSSRGIVWDPK